MKNKKFNYKILSILSIPLIGSISIIPIILSQKVIHLGTNLWTTYDNALDNSIALGIAPDYDTTSSAGEIKYGEYLKGFTNDSLTKYENINIMDGKEVNRIGIEKLKVDTMILNEWMKADEYKFDGIVNNIAYTSMGDSDAANYNESMISGGWNYTTQVSIDKAFSMQAKDLDKIYIDNAFENKANQIIAMDKERIQDLNSQNRNKFNKISIGFIAGGKTKTEIDSNFFFRSPGVYPFFYAQEQDKGLGLQFPEPKDIGFKNSTHYKPHLIKGDNSKQLLTQFKGKFDYLIYMTPDIVNYTKNDVLKSEIKSMLKDPLKVNTNIEIGSQGKWYISAWGIIGKRQLLTYITLFLNEKGHDITFNKKLIWNVPNKNNLKHLRHKDSIK